MWRTGVPDPIAWMCDPEFLQCERPAWLLYSQAAKR
jgi:hypothetical protein